jgi:hypothetical protein
LILSRFLAALPLTMALACGSGGDSKEAIDKAWLDCDELASRCHVHWMESAAASQCHDLGHDPPGKDPKMCTARKTECLALCPIVPKVPKDAGADLGSEPAGDGGEMSEAGMSIPPDAQPIDPEVVMACTSYCDCMQKTCTAHHTDPNFATSAACMTACTRYEHRERRCWANFCQIATQGMSPLHNCDHASGDLGLDECE